MNDEQGPNEVEGTDPGPNEVGEDTGPTNTPSTEDPGPTNEGDDNPDRAHEEDAAEADSEGGED